MYMSSLFSVIMDLLSDRMHFLTYLTMAILDRVLPIFFSFIGIPFLFFSFSVIIRLLV